MFLDYYGLREQPFGVTPDPRFLYLSPTHREALASLVYGIQTGRGFVALIAKSGMGKTTLLFQLLERLRSSDRTVFLFQTQCNSREFFHYLMTDLGLDTRDQDLVRMHQQLNEFLVREARAGKRFVLVIDEAQNLDNSVLETVRLLSNFETPSAKLMQIVLAGQTQLADKLARPALAQLRQRISTLVRLDPFTPEETDRYIEHRLRVAGYDGGPLFTSDAQAMISARSQGIPRNINTLCFNALSLGCALKRKRIDSSIMQEVIADLDVDSLISKPQDVHRPVASDSPAAPARPQQLALLVPRGGAAAPSRLSRWVPWASASMLLAGLAGGFWHFSALRPIAPEPPTNTSPPPNMTRAAPKTSATNTTASTPTAKTTRNANADRKKISAGINKGDIYIDRGEYDKAIREFQIGLILDPSNHKLRQKLERTRKAKATEQRVLH